MMYLLTRGVSLLFIATMWFWSIDLIHTEEGWSMGIWLFGACTLMISAIIIEAINGIRKNDLPY